MPEGKVMKLPSTEQKKETGISLRMIHVCLILLAVVVSCFLIYSANRLASTFQNLSDTTDQYLEMRAAATELMDSTDYLTEMAQRYTLDGNSIYLHRYFEESAATLARVEAILKMAQNNEGKKAVEQLQKAMDDSAKLRTLDVYAMRMVAEATGLFPLPEQLQSIVLEERHSMLPAREKKEAAQHMVSDEEYYREKDRSRRHMKESLDQLEENMRGVKQVSEMEVKSDLRWVRIVTVVQAAAIAVITLLLTHLGITPILKAAEKVRSDKPIPEIGANEFRYLASAYNKMYEVFKRSVASLNFKASHDELTKLYNRSGYELLLSSQDLSEAKLLLIDVDLFKHVNDTYGHEMGDRALQKVASTLVRFFRSGDYVCRIGGDEFAVIMMGGGKIPPSLIEEKVGQINQALQDTGDGLPPITISVGVADGGSAENAKQLYEHADQALYETKRHGRSGVSFYEPA